MLKVKRPSNITESQCSYEIASEPNEGLYNHSIKIQINEITLLRILKGMWFLAKTAAWMITEKQFYSQIAKLRKKKKETELQNERKKWDDVSRPLPEI